MTKILLGISVSAFLTSPTGALWGLLLPVGAICFGLFMIFNLLGTETALFDEEQRLRYSLARPNTPGSQRVQRPQRDVSLTAVSAH